MKLPEAQQLATKYQNMFKPYCHRVEIGGSIRREKLEVRNLELIAIPIIDQITDMFGMIVAQVNFLDSFITRFKLIKDGLKYKQIQLLEIKLDLFLATKENFGNLLLIRTGSA